METIMQGDEYMIPFVLKDKDGNDITLDDVEEVVITFGFLTKTLSQEEVLYRDGEWCFLLEQRESMCMSGSVPFEARVRFQDGDIIGQKLEPVQVVRSINKDMI